MEKSKFGFMKWTYPAMAFVMAILGQTLLCGLIAMAAIAAEKDEWVSKNCMQAFLLVFVSSFVSTILNILNVFRSIPFIGAAVGVIFGFITGVISLIVLVFAIIAIMNVAKGKDANVPVVKSVVGKFFGDVKIASQPVYQQPVSQIQSIDTSNETK